MANTVPYSVSLFSSYNILILFSQPLHLLRLNFHELRDPIDEKYSRAVSSFVTDQWNSEKDIDWRIFIKNIFKIFAVKLGILWSKRSNI